MENLTTKIDYQAVGDSIVVDPKITEKTEGGIIVPDQAQENNTTDYPEVLSVGEKVTSVKVGDKVAVHHQAHPTLLKMDGKKYFSIKEYDVIGKLYKQPQIITV